MATYTVVGLATDDGSTFAPAVVFAGNMSRYIASKDRRPFGGSVLYVVKGARNQEVAVHRALERFEADAAQGATVWEEGEVFYL